MPEQFDTIIIGAGQCAVPLARALAKAGRKTALIEREHIGGTCINEGCTPTKTMVASARVAYLVRRGADYGVKTGAVEVDMAVVRQRKRAIVDSFRDGSQHRLENTEHLSLIFGSARFDGPKTLAVDLNSGGTMGLTAETIVINAGARPSIPKLDGIDTVDYLTSTSIMELDVVPEHLIVLGGGYVGLEFAQMFRRFGSEVTVVQRGPKLLGQEDDDVAGEIAKIIREDGVRVLLNAQALTVNQSASGEINLNVTSPDGAEVLTGSHLLSAAGRTPNTDSLNLSATGLSANERGFIPVDETLETAVAGIFAAGDVNGGPAFTHIAYDDYRILKDLILEGKSRSTTGRILPYTLFTDPQLGRVGLSETQARAQGKDIRVAKMPMSYVARALETDESRGFMKVVVDAGSSQILGAAILGIEGGELMSMIEIAMLGGMKFELLRDAVFAHPTLAEAFNNLFFSLHE
jgi:pyruvate/2-oxoglutarate dehydrogenase complex dihydrolipoamide dehydrogenase (E3) component